MTRRQDEEESCQLMLSSTQLESQGKLQLQVCGRSTRQWTLGLFFLVLVAVIWTVASILVQYIFQDLGFHGPFFLTYMGTSLFSINLLFYYCTHTLFKGSTSLLADNSVSSPSSILSMKATFRISLKIAPLWFLANFSYNQSLSLTSITSSTVLSSTSTIFTFLFSLYLLKEHFTVWKILGVLLCVLGNISTIWQDSETDSQHAYHYAWLGDFCSLLGALMYALYTTRLSYFVPNDDAISMPLFFGFLGVINMVLLFPVVVGLHFSGIESLSGVDDYLWARAVLLTSPTVATVGLSLTVPMAIASDFIMHGIYPSAITIFSSALVLSSFLVTAAASQPQKKQHSSPKPMHQESLELS